MFIPSLLPWKKGKTQFREVLEEREGEIKRLGREISLWKGRRQRTLSRFDWILCPVVFLCFAILWALRLFGKPVFWAIFVLTVILLFGIRRLITMFFGWRIKAKQKRKESAVKFLNDELKRYKEEIDYENVQSNLNRAKLLVESSDGTPVPSPAKTVEVKPGIGVPSKGVHAPLSLKDALMKEKERGGERETQHGEGEKKEEKGFLEGKEESERKGKGRDEGLKMSGSQPIRPRPMSTLDKFLSHFVGLSPTNAYALICQHCGEHNGLHPVSGRDIRFVCIVCGKENFFATGNISDDETVKVKPKPKPTQTELLGETVELKGEMDESAVTKNARADECSEGVDDECDRHDDDVE